MQNGRKLTRKAAIDYGSCWLDSGEQLSVNNRSKKEKKIAQDSLLHKLLCVRHLVHSSRKLRRLKEKTGASQWPKGGVARCACVLYHSAH